MKLTRPLLASFAMVAVMVAVSAWALARLPPGPIPAHWALDGRPDRYAAPALVLFIMPAAAALISLLFSVIPALMPPRGDLSRSRRPYVVAWLAAVLLLLVVHLVMVAAALGAAVDMMRIVVVAVGVLLAVIGNVLPKARYNYVMGVRTPWTLASERVWDKTQRFAGVGMTMAGVVAAAGGLLVPAEVMLLPLLMVPLLTAVIASVVYSALISPRVGRTGSNHG